MSSISKWLGEIRFEGKIISINRNLLTREKNFGILQSIKFKLFGQEVEEKDFKTKSCNYCIKDIFYVQASEKQENKNTRLTIV